MRSVHEDVLDDLDALVAGDRDAIARHAEHLAGCDACRDAKHEAAQLAAQLAKAGADYVPSDNLVAALMAKLDAAPDVETKPVEAKAVETVAAKPAEAVAAKPAEKTTETVAAKPAEAVAAKPAEKATETVAAKPAEKPVEKPAAKPAAKAVDAEPTPITAKKSKRLVYVAGAMAALAAGTVGVVAMKKSGSGSSSTTTTTRGLLGGPGGQIKTNPREAKAQGDGAPEQEANGLRAPRTQRKYA